MQLPILLRERSDADRSHPEGTLRSQLLTGGAVLLVVALVTMSAVALVWVAAVGTSARLLVGLALVLLADLAVIFLFAGRILDRLVLDPISEMVEGTEAIASGDHERRIEPRGAQELRRLAVSVNQMARRLIANQKNLERNVASLEKVNRRLREAQEEVIRAEKLASVGRLAAGIAHGIGNPLGSIFGYTEVAHRDHPEAREWIESVEEEARRIDRIVKSLLEFARPREGVRSPTSLDRIVREVVDLLHAQGTFKDDVEVEISVAGEIPEVHCDPSHLEQVVVNLLLNAVDALQEVGGGTIEISVSVREELPGVLVARRSLGTAPPRRRDDPAGISYRHLRDDPGAPDRVVLDAAERVDRWVQLAVADDGPGVSEEDLSRLFDPFFTTKEPGRGTGLGLSVSSQLVANMGGAIRAEPRPEGGTRFLVLLPVGAPESRQ